MASAACRAACPRPSLVLAEQQGDALVQGARGRASGLRGFGRLTEAAPGGAHALGVVRVSVPLPGCRPRGAGPGSWASCVEPPKCVHAWLCRLPPPGMLEPPPGAAAAAIPALRGPCAASSVKSLSCVCPLATGLFFLGSAAALLHAPPRPRWDCGSQGLPARRQLVRLASWEGVRKGRHGFRRRRSWSASPGMGHALSAPRTSFRAPS